MEAKRKAQEVALAIEARKEVEQKFAKKMREKLQAENQKTRFSENEKRDRHKGELSCRKLKLENYYLFFNFLL